MMIDLAINGGKGPVRLKDVARRQHISEKYMGHLVPLLKNAGLINTARGAHGGFSLSKQQQDVTLKDIIAAVEGPICFADCVLDHDACVRCGSCAVQDFWGEATRKMIQVLESFTLKQLADDEKKKQVGLNYDI